MLEVSAILVRFCHLDTRKWTTFGLTYIYIYRLEKCSQLLTRVVLVALPLANKKERRQDRDGECRELIDGVVSEELESRVSLHHPYIVTRCG